MFVLVDMEWMTNKDGHHSPTQIAAIKVNEQWQEIDKFQSYIRPRDPEFHDWDHVSYTGGTAYDFLHARNAYSVFEAFENWLNEEDIILWWYVESERLFKKLISLILKNNELHKAVSINEYVYEFLSGQPSSRGSSYKIAEGRGITTHNTLKHNSFNDVLVMRKLMEKISFPQDDLLKPLIRKPKQLKPSAQAISFPLQYDPKTNTIHKKECSLLADGTILTQGYINWKSPLRKEYHPCDCCKEEYRIALRERNMDIIERSQYTFLYSPESKVFHKYTCGSILSAKHILGSMKYQTAVDTGRIPCKLCNPSAEDKYRPLPPQVKVQRLKKKTKKLVKKTDARAIARQKIALEERYRRLNDETLTQIEKNDIYTLTQPRFAFWVGKGYQTFHLRNCVKMNDISNLKGFGTYSEAIHAGFTPCRICKPTAKHDVKVSIPINNRVREDEKIEDIETMCNDAGYTYYRESNYLYLETSVGKWRIKINTSPVKLEHINLVKTPGCKTYHEQPRIFLSFIDTFDYIKRHDDNLAEQKSNGKVFAKLFP